MGAHPYWYVEALDGSVSDVLERLRRREFEAGRYNPVMPFITFPITPGSPAPGPRHASIEDACEAAGADGTRSILDVTRVTDQPEFCAACTLSDDVLTAIYGTTHPTRAAVEADMDFLENVERGEAVYVLLYEDSLATEVLFAGCSLD